MTLIHHSLPELFEQLGLDATEQAIQAFVQSHKIKDNALVLAKASFWNQNQAVFIQEAWFEDSDWASVVDELDNLLRD